MRPTTPMPDGCEFTLLSLVINWPNHKNQQNLKESNNGNVHESSPQRSRLSLKKAKSPQRNIGNQSYNLKNKPSPVNNSLQGNKHFFEIQSVSKKEREYHEGKANAKENISKDWSSVRKGNESIIESANINTANKNQFSELSNNFIHKEFPLMVFEKNHAFNSSFEKNMKTTFNTTEKERHSLIEQIQREEENKKKNSFGFTKTIPKNERFPEGYRSEIVTLSQRPSSLQKQSLRPPALKQSNLTSNFQQKVTFTQKENLSFSKNQNESFSKTKLNPHIESRPIFENTLVVPNPNDVENQETSQVKSQFKFHTLKELSCKSVSSNGGEKTSSNHMSLLASEESFFAAHAKGNPDFEKTVKLMTMKNVPLLMENF